jgi:hypothetical protein
VEVQEGVIVKGLVIVSVSIDSVETVVATVVAPGAA